MKIFSIHDSKAEAYLPPIMIKTTGEALRAIEEAVRTSDHQFAKHPQDYTLYELGKFDELTGKIELYEDKKHLINLAEYKH